MSHKKVDPDKELEEENERLRKENEKLRKEIDRLKKAKEKIEKDFKEYQMRHPESVGIKNGKPYVISETTKKPHRKKVGAKVGHKPHNRKVPGNIDETVHLTLEECPLCHSNNLSTCQGTRERIVEDIPVYMPIVTKYIIERKYCVNCKKVVENKNVPALPKARIGLRTMLTVTWMKIGLRMTVRHICKQLKTVFNLYMSKGEVIQILNQVRIAFGSYYQQLLDEIRKALSRHMDETMWKINGKKSWLWGFFTKATSLYHIANERNHKVPLNLLGDEASGVNVRDRHSLYNTLSKKNKKFSDQYCWSHILCDSKELSTFYPKDGKYIHRILKRVYKKAKKYDHKGTKENVIELIMDLECLLEKDYKSVRCHRFVRNLLSQKDNLFIFVTNPDVESTNNRAERGLRHSVIARKISGGSKSDKGAEAHSVLTSVVQTLELRDLNIVSDGPSILRTSHG